MTNLPRVTQLIAEMGLMEGSAFYQPKHRRRGRYVHHWAHEIARGGEVDAEWLGRRSGDPAQDDEVVHAEVLPYLEGVRNALAENDIVVESVEVAVCNRNLLYVGHIDWKAAVRERKAIIDLKCGPTEQPWHKIQDSLYVMAAVDQDWRTIKHVTLYERYILYLSEQFSRNYKLVQHSDPRDRKDAEIFVQAYHARKRYVRGEDGAVN